MIYLRCPEALYEALVAMAAEYDTTMTAICNRALATYLAEKAGYEAAAGRALP